jgi:archaellin
MMRNYAMVLCSVLLIALVFVPGCTTQDTGTPITAPAPQGVNDTPMVTPPASPVGNIHLPFATPAPQVVYVTVTVPVPVLATATVPVPTPTSGETVCRGTEQTAAGIRMTGSVYGLASAPEAGIDEIRFTIGLDSCSRAMDLTQLQIVFSTLDAPAVTLNQGTRTSTGFFTTKTGTAKVTLMNPGDQVEIAFFVAPVPANTRMNIELKTPGGATVPFTTTAPARISARNLLS